MGRLNREKTGPWGFVNPPSWNVGAGCGTGRGGGWGVSVYRSAICPMSVCESSVAFRPSLVKRGNLNVRVTSQIRFIKINNPQWVDGRKGPEGKWVKGKLRVKG